jgi:hypothetical protein
MTAGRELTAGFALHVGTVAQTLNIVLRHKFIIIVEMRIFEILVPLRSRFNGMFRFVHIPMENR